MKPDKIKRHKKELFPNVKATPPLIGSTKSLKADKALADGLQILKVITGKEVKILTDEALTLLFKKYKRTVNNKGYILPA